MQITLTPTHLVLAVIAVAAWKLSRWLCAAIPRKAASWVTAILDIAYRRLDSSVGLLFNAMQDQQRVQLEILDVLRKSKANADTIHGGVADLIEASLAIKGLLGAIGLDTNRLEAIQQFMDLQLDVAKGIHSSLDFMTAHMSAEEDLPEPEPINLSEVSGPIVAELKEVVAVICALRSRMDASAEVTKQLMNTAFGIAAGESAEEDEILSRARELCRQHPGLKLEDAMSRVRHISVYGDRA